MRPLLLLAALLLAGCVAPSAPGGTATPPLPLPTYGYACPEGPVPPGPCGGALARDGVDLTEPFAAVDPADVRRMAVGTNAASPALVQPAGASGSLDVRQLAVHTTSDGGATWRASVPLPPGDPPPGLLRSSADPSLLFDGDGRLHLTAILSEETLAGFADSNTASENEDFPSRIVHLVSADLGRTWSEPRVLSENGHGQDRNWISRDPATGRLFVLWQNIYGPTRGTTEVAWSGDGGATWRNQRPDQRAPCHWPGQMVLWEGTPVFPCQNNTDEHGNRIFIDAFDPASGDASAWGEVQTSSERRITHAELTPLPGVLRMLRYHYTNYVTDYGHADMQVQDSGDGGRTWGPPQGLVALAAEGWASAQAYWSAADPWGGHHLLVKAARPLAQGHGNVTLHERALLHVVLDPGGGAVHRGVLESWTDLDHPRRQPVGDDYYGVAWAQDLGLLAWTKGSEVHWVLVRPHR